MPYGAVGARFVVEQLAVPALRFERGITARVLAAVPAGTTDYRPAAGARSVVELAHHIVGAELRFLEGAVTGAFPERLVECEAVADMRELAAVYEKRATALAEQLQGSPGEHLLRVLDYRGLFSLPALGFVQFALNHTIHHRGQLSVYLRATGTRVPQIYG